MSVTLLLLALLTGCVRSEPATPAASTGQGGPSVTRPPLSTTMPTEEPTPTVAPTPTPDDGAQVVEVSLLDTLLIQPARITVKAGTPVRFVISNEGALEHDFFLGNDREQKDRESGRGEPGPERYVKVPPGETVTLSYTFAKPGKTIAGCVVPGHYSSGMKANITIE